MKYILMFLLAAGSFMAASAQSGWHDRSYPAYERDRGAVRIDEINREYDRRVWQVEHDISITPRMKRKMIREINEERHYRLKAARKWERRERRAYPY